MAILPIQTDDGYKTSLGTNPTAAFVHLSNKNAFKTPTVNPFLIYFD